MEGKKGFAMPPTGNERKEKTSNFAATCSELARSYKKSYMEGLDIVLKAQEDSERLFSQAIHQGFAISKECLSLPQLWLHGWNDLARNTVDFPNPWIGWAKQNSEVFRQSVDLCLNQAEECYGTWFSLYKKVMAPSIRKYTRQMHKDYMEVMIPE